MSIGRKALVVGINRYQHVNCLYGCVNDAQNISQVLERNENGEKNFDIKTLLSDAGATTTHAEILDAMRDLFESETEVALLYFSGHGFVDDEDGFLVSPDSYLDGDNYLVNGIPMSTVLGLANKSKAKSRVIILDCCHAGQMGNGQIFANKAVLSEGVTILASAKKDQYAEEKDGSGVFTNLLIDALNGSAANLMGDVTAGSVYALIDQALGEWEQRPVFKTHVQNFVSLRKAKVPIPLAEVHQVTELFKNPNDSYVLDPSYEPTEDSHTLDHTKIFSVLQHYNHVNMLLPEGEEHMYYAAIHSKLCRLTALGRHYWNLVKKKQI